jgi:histidyl-tRNA synthetase
VISELTERGLAAGQAADLVATLTAADSADRVRIALTKTDEGTAGLDEVDTILSLLSGQIPAGRIAFTPRMVRGLSYYTGPIWEVTAAGVAGSIGSGGRYDHLIEQLGGPDVPGTGSSLGVERVLAMLPGGGPAEPSRLDVAVTTMRPELETGSFALAAAARSAGLRASVYLGSSGKLGRQLKWASDAGARWCLIYGEREHEAGAVTVRDMRTGEQVQVPSGEVASYLTSAGRSEA